MGALVDGWPIGLSVHPVGEVGDLPRHVVDIGLGQLSHDGGDVVRVGPADAVVGHRLGHGQAAVVQGGGRFVHESSILQIWGPWGLWWTVGQLAQGPGRQAPLSDIFILGHFSPRVKKSGS